jgi:hypothetical protein
MSSASVTGISASEKEGMIHNVVHSVWKELGAKQGSGGYQLSTSAETRVEHSRMLGKCNLRCPVDKLHQRYLGPLLAVWSASERPTE